MQSHPIEVNTVPPTPHHVTIDIHEDDADRLSWALSDLLCWCSGFMAGRDDSAHHPQGVEAARTLNLALKRALAKKD